MELVYIYDHNDRLKQIVPHDEIETNSMVVNTLRFVWLSEKDFDRYFELKSEKND